MWTPLFLTLSLALSLISLPAQAAGGVALRTSAGFDTFSRCAAEESIRTGNAFTMKGLLHAEVPEGSTPSRLAHLYFRAVTSGGTEITLRLSFKAKTPEGWQLVQGENGEIFPYATAVEPKALLDSQNGGTLGARDISRCFY